jgi:S1-C subfamily serine protease
VPDPVADHDAPDPSWPAPVPRSVRATRRRHRRLRRLGIFAVTLVVAGSLALSATSWPGGSTSSSSAAGGTAGQARDVASESLDTDTIAARVDPAVVDISTTLAYGSGEAAGTGMIITSTGEILTNNHVIEGADTITVAISTDGRTRTYDAELLGTDPADDVALLSVHGVSDLPTVELGDSSQVAVGDRVVAIGNALNLPGPPRVTEGHVAAIDRAITVRDEHGNPAQLTGLLQTDAELSPGNSGGPLVDASGRVVGINTAAEVDQQSTSSTTGFAIPIEHAQGIVDQIENGDESDGVQVGPTAFLGVQSRDGDGRTATGAGALVVGVVEGGPAEDAGLTTGAVVTEFDGRAVATADALVEAVHAHDPGDKVSITWLDDANAEQHATVRLDAGPAA